MPFEADPFPQGAGESKALTFAEAKGLLEAVYGEHDGSWVDARTMPS
jgi:hypothetical protein